MPDCYLRTVDCGLEMYIVGMEGNGSSLAFCRDIHGKKSEYYLTLLHKEKVLEGDSLAEKKKIPWELFDHLVRFAVDLYQKGRITFVYPSPDSKSVKGRYCKKNHPTDLIQSLSKENIPVPDMELKEILDKKLWSMHVLSKIL